MIIILSDFFNGNGFIQLVGIIAGILTSISMLPQVIKTFKEKSSEDLSIVMLLILVGGIACWIYYGILRKDLPIIFTNAFSLLVNITLVILHIKYKDKK